MTEKEGEEREEEEPEEPVKEPLPEPRSFPMALPLPKDMKKFEQAMNAISLILEVLPPIEVKPMRYQGRNIIAIIIDRPKK